MNTQSNTTVRELSLEDLDRVSGAGIKAPEHGHGVVGPEYARAHGIIGPEIAGIRGVVAPEI